MDSDQQMKVAETHVTHVRDFFYHLMVFVLVNMLLVVVDLRSTSDQAVLGLDWAYWVIIGWGFGLLGHAVWAFFDTYRVQKAYRNLSHQ